MNTTWLNTVGEFYVQTLSDARLSPHNNVAADSLYEQHNQFTRQTLLSHIGQ